MFSIDAVVHSHELMISSIVIVSFEIFEKANFVYTGFSGEHNPIFLNGRDAIIGDVELRKELSGCSPLMIFRKRLRILGLVIGLPIASISLSAFVKKK